MADDQQDGKQPGGSGKGGGTLGDLVKAESMIQLALVLPAACFIGWLIGVGLDKHFKTGWMEIAGVLLGAVAGFVQIIRTASRYMNRSGQ